MRSLILVGCLVIILGCATEQPASVSLMPPVIKVPVKLQKNSTTDLNNSDLPPTNAAPLNLYLTWSNSQTYQASVVEYKNNLSDSWKIYCVITNGNTNQSYVKLDKTNDNQYYRVANIYY